MGASQSLYFNIDAKYKDSVATEMIVNPAISWDFETGITDMNTLSDWVKSVFKLDALVPFQANVGGVTYHGFWGICNAGSFNSQFHNSTRVLGVNVPSSVVNRIMFNDAGLNIKAYVRNDQILSTQLSLIRVSPLLDVPFCNPLTQVRMYWSVTRGGVPVSGGSGVSYINTVYEDKGKTMNPVLNINASDKTQYLDEVTYYFQAENEEGIWEDASPAYVFTVARGSQYWSYNGMYASYAVYYPTSSSYVYYNSNPFIGLGVEFFTIPTGLTYTPNGYYADFERWYQIDNGQIIDMGWHGSWPAGDPEAPRDYVTFTVYGVDNTQLNIQNYLQLIDYDTGSGWDTPFSIYRSTRSDATNGKFYVNTALTNLVSNSYYVFPYGGGDTSTLLSNRFVRYARMTDGVWVENWEYDIQTQLFEQVSIP